MLIHFLSIFLYPKDKTLCEVNRLILIFSNMIKYHPLDPQHNKKADQRDLMTLAQIYHDCGRKNLNCLDFYDHDHGNLVNIANLLRIVYLFESNRFYHV